MNHYICLKSANSVNINLNIQKFSERILRLPMHTELTKNQIIYICKSIESFLKFNIYLLLLLWIFLTSENIFCIYIPTIPIPKIIIPPKNNIKTASVVNQLIF